MSKRGIVSYGTYIPKYRLNRQVIAKAFDWFGVSPIPGEKAVKSYDEDSVTMAVAAGINCLNGISRNNISSVYFSSTTSPFQERDNASIISAALNLQPGVQTANFADSMKAGTTAIRLACSSDATSVLCCTAECRTAKPGSNQEMLFGDAAAAVLIGAENTIADFEGSYSISYDFPDYRRLEGDKLVKATEERFIREQGYKIFIPELISGLLTKYGLGVKDISRVAFPCLNNKEHAAIGKGIGFSPEQIQPPLVNEIGESGTASPLVSLAAILDKAKPGDRFIIASYGQGAEALLFKVTDKITQANRGGLKENLDNKADLGNYVRYLVFRDMLSIETGFPEDVAPTELPLTWRDRKVILSLEGSKCKKCGTPQYPPQRVCVNPGCGAVNQMEPYIFADKLGTVFSFTKDFNATSLNPPLLYGMIDFAGGGRYMFELADCKPDEVTIGMKVKMVLRRKYVDVSRSIIGYCWKALPVKENKGENK